MTAAASSCPGCGWVGGPSAGPAHPYIGASPACWERYGELLAVPATGQRRLAVDAYAVQHPGRAERRSVQSVGAHAMVLCLVLEDGMAVERADVAIRRILARPPRLRWLDPPRPGGWLTVADVVAAGGTPELIEEWARSVWTAWRPHHPAIRRWVDDVFGSRPAGIDV